MAKGIKSKTRTVALKNNAVIASGSNLILTEADMGTARNALLVIMADISDSIVDIHVASSQTTGTPATGTDVATNNSTVVQDTVNSTATTTIASKKFTIASDGIYVYNVHNLKRYANVQYTGTDTAGLLSVALIGLDLEQAPYAAATSAY